jgi:transketolase
LYAAWAEGGAFPVERLKTLREFTSDLEGHPTPRIPWVEVATGSLGQGLSCGIGMALNSKYLDQICNRIFVLMGDGEGFALQAEQRDWYCGCERPRPEPAHDVRT